MKPSYITIEKKIQQIDFYLFFFSIIGGNQGQCWKSNVAVAILVQNCSNVGNKFS